MTGNKKKQKSANNNSSKKNKQTSIKKTAKTDKYETAKAETKNVKERNKGALERNDAPMTIVGHLNEMRSRLIVSLVTIIFITLAVFTFFSDYILNVINMPYNKTGLMLNVFNISEGFILRAKASLITGIFIGLPIIVYEIWKYIVPAVDKQHRKFIGRSIIAAVALLYTGMTLTYFFLLPIAIKMLLRFTPDNVNNIIGAGKYLNFVTIFSLSMGILCELPILIMILTKIGIITPKLLISKRKYAIVLIWIFAAILTPGPDILSMALVAIPIMFLYEISIIISKMIIKRKIKYG